MEDADYKEIIRVLADIRYDMADMADEVRRLATKMGYGYGEDIPNATKEDIRKREIEVAVHLKQDDNIIKLPEVP